MPDTAARPTGTSAHAMPFGAEVRPDGTVRFRLWAPAQPSVSLLLDDAVRSGPQVLAMHPLPGGWHEIVTDAAGPGTLYRFELESGLVVPDPASRHQPADVTGSSVVVDPAAYLWRATAWKGRPWHETVLYELHVGTFTPEGTFAAAAGKLDRLADLGITAVELMPLSDFPGRRGWGYDGVLPFAPESIYGNPDELKAFVDAAHARGLQVFLDVVYNHFGPEGNWLHAYAPGVFTERHHTPWGAAINYDGADARPVRDFFVHNALYWLEEYRIDGLRLDAVHAIIDDGPTHVLDEIAATVRRRLPDRHVHLVLENDANQARFLGADRYDAQWNDDWHHAAHVLLTGETGGYYADYADRPLAHMARCLAEGFAYQGEPSAHRDGAARGEPSASLPPTSFVAFLQNHDQVGNRAMGERLPTLVPDRRPRSAMTVVLLMAPSIPLLFMGEEWDADTPFPYFCDFHGDLADAVREGRRAEFARFPAFSDPAARERIPDPVAPETAASAVLDWSQAVRGPHAEWRTFVRELLSARMREVVPLIGGRAVPRAEAKATLPGRIDVTWAFPRGTLSLVANLAAEAAPAERPAGRLVALNTPDAEAALGRGRLPGWSALVFRAGEDR